ncbi:hypothetical protein Cgig2_020104 [Carnegiea gigantea]|uniref:HVA22-like protein n=1 Tax=Carnegiea gigantea TaxID=171969 RepID=A0A9Q1QHG5_9CARY|nr:hypothetical protein Cgig2_020104 [Carnegiea gigantea]
MLMQVGLQLLLSPLSSNIVVRTACCSVGVALPMYSTFKAIERKDPNEQQKWLVYWAAYGSFTLAEMITDKLIHCFKGPGTLRPERCAVSVRLMVDGGWFPLYYHMKFAFLVWLQLPSADGATQLYMNYLRPFLLRHQARLDYVVGFLYGEMDKFVATHQTELQFAKKVLASIVLAANQVMKEILRPGHKDVSRSIERPTELEEDSHPEHED